MVVKDMDDDVLNVMKQCEVGRIALLDFLL